MYLQALELIGFKSFAERTRLTFQPGMTAIVGPNGCGKSNVSDAVRWTLGEQSAKALRSVKMEDCIFNGTDQRKPMGMAEVSLTFAECEDILGTEYHEVTVTRRVFRSGEGQYFINKTPCRRKDIQRLFLGTGIGTTSYSLMEQGRIDQVLSSRPEERRAVFEEASGITRFKTDKKEALRKLDQTEANLTRLSDVIREVKRQIGSVQRQAGKARRYQAFRDELRDLETARARQLISEFNRRLEALTCENAASDEALAATERQIAELTTCESGLRSNISQLDEATGVARQSAADYRARLERDMDRIRFNRERIAEQSQRTEREQSEIETAQSQRVEQTVRLESLREQVLEARQRQGEAARELDKANRQWHEHEAGTTRIRKQVEELQRETVEAENALARLQNELTDLEQSERTTVLRRERLLAEQEQASSIAGAADAREQEMAEQTHTLQGSVEESEQSLSTLRQRREAIIADISATDERLKELQASLAGTQGQLEILTAAEAEAQDFPGGARVLMDSATDAGKPSVLGPLAHAIEVEDGYLPAVDAVLRPISDALLVSDCETAMQAIAHVAGRHAGSVRLAALKNANGLDNDGTQGDGAGSDNLLKHIRCRDEVRPLMQRLLGNVRVVATALDLPSETAAGERWVTRDGIFLRGDGAFEYRDPAEAAADPLARRHRIRELRRRLDGFKAEISNCLDERRRLGIELDGLDAGLEQQQRLCDERRRALALHEGQELVISRDAARARQRLTTVSFELEQLEKNNRDNGLKKTSISTRMGEVHAQRENNRRRIEERNQSLRDLDQQRTPLFDQVSEQRLRAAEIDQRLQHLEGQAPAIEQRLREIEQVINDRGNSISAANESIKRMTGDIDGMEKNTVTLEASFREEEQRIEEMNSIREGHAASLKAADEELKEQRHIQERLRSRHSELQVGFTEHRMKRSNLIERMTSEYNISETELTAPRKEVEDPADQGEPLEVAERDDRILEIKSRLDAMGPVNLVAIEEYRELEERHAFLSLQHDDLVKSRQQLLDTIRRINTSTSEMFTETFNRVNDNFQAMFTKLFNGGKASLQLTDSEDVLESGIDIVARPPGKRQQSIGLLSGGERTLTAVALLFAIYMIKPSPFCILDEIDATLDESNINRFLDILRGFLDQSQFIIITHNRRTIAAAKVIYGVTMPENGLSRTLSMKFHERENAEILEPASQDDTDAKPSA